MIRRLIVSYLALTLVVLVMLEIPLGITYRERQREQLEADLERDAFVLAAYSEDTLEGIGTLDLQALADGYTDRTGGRVVFVDRNGDVRADSDPAVEGPRSFSSRPEIEAALASQVSSGVRPSTTLGTDLLYVAVPVTSGGTIHGAVRISYPTSELDERVRSYWLLLGGVAAVSLTVAAGLAVVMARWVTRPVADLQVAATAIGQGALDARAPTGTGPPEIRELARALNTTAGRLEDLVDTQEQFVADASHELRTPLTALRLRLEMLETEVGDGAAHDLVAAEGEVQRLSRLVDGLLALARADRAPSSDAEDIAVDEVLAERADAWSAVVTERALRLEVTPSGLRVRATRDRLDQVLDNLLANACDAAPTGSVVGMGARMADDGSPDPMVDIHLTDSGPGLTEEQRSRAFDRFWRAGTTRTELGGSGLGLAIVRKLVRADQGDVELRAASPRGLEVIVRLPAAPSRRREN